MIAYQTIMNGDMFLARARRSELNQLVDLGINLTAAVIAFALGAMTRNFVHYLRVRRGRKFWGEPVSGEETVVFLGAVPERAEFKSYEPSGLIGMGDTHAVQELTTLLNDLDIKFTLSYIRQSYDQQRKNLVLVGAEEVNGLVDRLKDRYESNYEYELGPMAIMDIKKRVRYQPVWEADSKEIRFDYGTLIRAENPYMPGRTIVAFGGLYGFGTWGGVRAITHPDFKHQERMLDTSNVECLFRVEVLNGGILGVDILDVSPLAARNYASLPSEGAQPAAEEADRTG